MPDSFAPHIVAAFRAFSWIVSLAAIVLGASVLVGWAIGNQSLETIRPGLAAMSPLTAVSFILAGGSLTARRWHASGLPSVFAGGLPVIGIIVLASYAIFGRDALNPMLEAWTPGGAAQPGNTSPATAFAIILLGGALLSVGKRNLDPVLIWFAAPGVFLTALALLGYAYGVEDLYAVAFYRTMALHTAIGLFAMFLACLVAVPEAGWAGIVASAWPSGLATRRQLVLATLLPFMIGFVVLHGVRAGQIGLGLGVAIVVAATMVPLVFRILRDGQILDLLEMQRSAATKALQDLNATLEERVAERTATLEVAQTHLRQSQKMEAVGQLTGGLAHDFNNLLTGIGGSLDMMKTRAAQGRHADVDRYLGAAQASVRRAAALTHRLLAFSRRQTLDPKATDANRLIAGMVELIQRAVGLQVGVEIVGAAGLWPVLVDPNQLENAILNLSLNARDAMPDGGKLTIETANRWLDARAGRERDLPPGQYVSVCVSDNGTGMSAEVVERAYDPFFTTKPIGLGTGLGLSMVHGFVRQSGGQTRIYSEVGQGTMVCLYLPRHLAAPDDAVEADLVAAPGPDAAGMTVLVVDDEATIRMLVCDVLEELKITAIEAEDGAAGLKVLQSNIRIDLLVTDVGLPGGMNGRQVADAARVARPELKVLFITGYAENAVLNHGHLEPGMHVLSKPFAMDTLANRIRALVCDDVAL
jgi:signal transduction histidine kinase/CheY-like chemotaxis protein